MYCNKSLGGKSNFFFKKKKKGGGQKMKKRNKQIQTLKGNLLCLIVSIP